MNGMRFNFVGEIGINGDDARVPGFRVINGKANGLSFNATVIAAQNNRAFVECAGFKNDQILTFDTDGKIEINWDDRKDPDIVKKVANYRKNVITLNGERHEFISAFDFVDFIRDNADEIKGKEYTVTGQIQKNEYNGKISDRFVIQNMYELTEDKPHKLTVSGEFYFNADGIDLVDWKSEKKVNFNGYTKEYMSKDHPNVYVPRLITFDCSKIDFNNDGHIALVNYKLLQMGLSYDEGKVKINLKKNTYYKMCVILNYINGAEKIDFDESTLTANQKMALKLGIKTIDDFRPNGAIFGERVQLYKLVDFDIKGDFADGCVKVDEKPSEFEENIYASANDETIEDFEKKMNKPTSSNDDDDMEDLFS